MQVNLGMYQHIALPQASRQQPGAQKKDPQAPLAEGKRPHWETPPQQVQMAAPDSTPKAAPNPQLGIASSGEGRAVLGRFTGAAKIGQGMDWAQDSRVLTLKVLSDGTTAGWDTW